MINEKTEKRVFIFFTTQNFLMKPLSKLTTNKFIKHVNHTCERILNYFDTRYIFETGFFICNIPKKLEEYYMDNIFPTLLMTEKIGTGEPRALKINYIFGHVIKKYEKKDDDSVVGVYFFGSREEFKYVKTQLEVNRNVFEKFLSPSQEESIGL
ncbi:MAG: hypothetical protein DRI92_05780 [Aquificota bacterium]|nr:MAG: hypothetical protein DRI92_05780 [Aquificota bacterium]